MLFTRKKEPSAEAVMRRVIILKYIFVTGLATPPSDYLSSVMDQWSTEEISQFKRDGEQMGLEMVEQLKSGGIWQAVEDEEREFLRRGIAQINSQQQIDASWLAESIACLLWALEIIPELPLYDRETDHELVKALLPRPIKDLLRQARLRSLNEIKKQRGIAELWHWRARTRRLQEEGQLSGTYGGLTIEQIIAATASKAAENGDIETPIGDDFAVIGRPYRSISPEEFVILTSIAQERHKAFNWLCGLSPTEKWTDTPTNT